MIQQETATCRYGRPSLVFHGDIFLTFLEYVSLPQKLRDLVLNELLFIREPLSRSWNIREKGEKMGRVVTVYQEGKNDTPRLLLPIV